MDGWVKIKSAAKYAGISERTFRDWLKTGLRHVKLPTGALLVKYMWIDDFLENHEVDSQKQVDEVVAEVCKELLS